MFFLKQVMTQAKTRTILFIPLLALVLIFRISYAAAAEVQADLLRYYRAHPVPQSTFDVLAENPVEISEPHLPDRVRTMLDRGDMTLLQSIYQELSGKLDRQAEILRDAIGVFYRTSANPPAVQLGQLVNHTEDSLYLAENLVNHLLLWLDWFPDEDWPEQYGSLYTFLTGARRLNLVYRCQTVYGQAIASVFQSRTGLDGQGDQLRLLHQTIHQIDQFDPQHNDGRLSIWRVRLYHACHRLSGTTVFQQPLQKAYDQFEMIRCEGELEIERNLLQIEYNADKQAIDYDLLLKRCQQVFEALRDSQADPAIVQVLRLRAAMLTSQIMQRQIYRSAMTGPVAQENYHQLCLFNTTYLQTLVRATEGQQEYIEFARTMIVNRLQASLDQILEKGKSGEIGSLVAKWPADWQYGLADRYFYATPARYDIAIPLYQQVVRQTGAGELIPAAWYKLGLSYDQQALKGEYSENIRADLLQNATRSLLQFSQKFPTWRPNSLSGLRGDDLPGQAIERAAAIVCGELDANYDALRLEVLQTLCGALNDTEELSGSFADRPAARSCRYFYARALHQAGQLNNALIVYRLVDKDDNNYIPAQLGWLQTQYQILSVTPETEPWQPLAEQIKAFILQYSDHVASIDATVLLIDIFGKITGWSDCLHVVGIVCQAHPDEPLLGQAILSQAATVSSYLDKRYRSRWQDKDIILLQDWLMLTDYAVQTSQVDSDALLLKAARSYRQEAAAWLALAALNFKPVKLPRLIIDNVRKELAETDTSPTLATIRYRAMLTYADGDYDQSRRFWYLVRQGTDPDNPESADRWWESRYYSLKCLFNLGQHDEAVHAAEVLLRSYENQSNIWKNHITQLIKSPQ